MPYRLGLALLFAGACFADGPELFAPSEGSTVKPGKFRAVAKAGGSASFTLDGKSVPATQAGPGAWFADMTLPPGDHELVAKDSAGQTRVRFRSAPAATFKEHPPLGNCDTCHAVKADAWAMKRASLAPVCSACHPQDRFAVVHTHGTDVLADCQNCHFPHGSTVKSHLKTTKDAGCRQCHSRP